MIRLNIVSVNTSGFFNAAPEKTALNRTLFVIAAGILFQEFNNFTGSTNVSSCEVAAVTASLIGGVIGSYFLAAEERNADFRKAKFAVNDNPTTGFVMKI